LTTKVAWKDAQSEGNGCLGVIVDTTAADKWPAVDETIFAALQHLGLPYRVLDLSQARLPAEALGAFRAVLLAQAHLGGRLAPADAEALRAAVRAGMGLVCFDGDLTAYPAALREVFGLPGDGFTLQRQRVRLGSDDQFITGTRERGEMLTFDRPVDVCRVDAPGWADPGHCLLTTDDGWPALVAHAYGQGRVVAWTLSPLIWSQSCFGHGMGLDDLFWKGIVWAARKPFVMRAMPPFVTFVLDDASSSYNHFRYLDAFNDHGYIPHVGVYLDDIDKVMHDVQGQDSQALKAKHDAGLATVAAHGFSYDHEIFYDHVARCAWPGDVLAENFQRFDQTFRQWGIEHSRMLNAHFGEVGLNALPYLRERGIEFLATTMPYGQAWFEPEGTRRPWKDPAPYHNIGFVFDTQPGAPEFFVTTARLKPREMTGAPLIAVDFLWGHTIFWDEHPADNNLAGAAEQALAQMRRGLDSLFYGELMTHEQRLAVLSMHELDQTLTLIDRGLAKYGCIHRSYEYIAEYARSKVNSRLTAVNVDGGGQITCDLAGRTSLTTSLYLFTEWDGTIQQRFVDVPPFAGSARVTC
jgi:hypothetical protein